MMGSVWMEREGLRSARSQGRGCWAVPEAMDPAYSSSVRSPHTRTAFVSLHALFHFVFVGNYGAMGMQAVPGGNAVSLFSPGSSL